MFFKQVQISRKEFCEFSRPKKDLTALVPNVEALFF